MSNRGGYRPGAGRPPAAPDGSHRLHITLGASDVETLDAIRATRGGSRTDAVRYLIREHTALLNTTSTQETT